MIKISFLIFKLKLIFCCSIHSGNNGMLCKSVYDSIERGNVTFIEADSTFCQTNQTYHWFNSTDPMPIRQLDIMKQLNSECPSFPGHGNCSCTPERLTYVENEEGTRMVYALKVDCSNLGLTSLPQTLPETTVALNVSNNNVSMGLLCLRFNETNTLFSLRRSIAFRL